MDHLARFTTSLLSSTATPQEAVGDKKIDLKDKAVFVGISEVLLAERKDSFYTVFSQANGIFIGGVEITGNRVLKPFGRYASETHRPAPFLHSYYHPLGVHSQVSFVVCPISPVAALSIVGLSILYLFVAGYQFKTNNSWYPVVIPLFFQTPLAFFGAVVWNYIDINKERQNIKKAPSSTTFRKMSSTQLAKDIAHIKTGSRVVYGICLFTDAADYTSLAETMDSVELGRLMNTYYETMFKPVKQHGGFISGVIGDSMLALWVAASSEAFLRKKACLAALDIKKALSSSRITRVRTA